MDAQKSGFFLSDVYIAASQEPAEQVFDYRRHHAPPAGSSSSEATALDPVILRDIHDKPLVWVVPDLLTAEEIHNILQTFEGGGSEHQAFGKDLPQSLPALTGPDEEGPKSLSHALLPRLQHDFAHRQKNRDASNIHSVCSKWRVLKLQEDEEFPAHQDGMDSYHASEGFCVSTHSILLDLRLTPRQRNSCQNVEEDCAVRFYYRTSPSESMYHNSIDVLVPNGYGIIFEQHKDLYYAAQALRRNNKDKNMENGSTRYLAQAGLMRTLAKGCTMESLRGVGTASSFVLGPGLLDLLEQEAELANGLASPMGWGRNFNPKATLWKHGRPIIKVNRSSIMQQQQRHSLGLLINERRWSTVSQDNMEQDIRKESQRRKSLQSQVDPIRKRVSYVDKLCGDNKHEDDTTEFSTYHEEDPVTITPIPSRASSYKPYRVTRKPKENSLVERLVHVFQRN